MRVPPQAGKSKSPNSCPATHPYAYRPEKNFDYCCETTKDYHGRDVRGGVAMRYKYSVVEYNYSNLFKSILSFARPAYKDFYMYCTISTV